MESIVHLFFGKSGFIIAIYFIYEVSQKRPHSSFGPQYFFGANYHTTPLLVVQYNLYIPRNALSALTNSLSGQPIATRFGGSLSKQTISDFLIIKITEKLVSGRQAPAKEDVYFRIMQLLESSPDMG
jgi:hypothetical protein